MDKEIQLVYIHNLGLNSESKYHYNFYFIPKDLKLCNENWMSDIAGLFNDIYIPDKSTKIYSLITSIPLGLITDNLCLGMKNAIDGVVALAWEDISDYEEYPEEGRLILYYGLSFDEVNDILEKKGEKLVE